MKEDFLSFYKKLNEIVKKDEPLIVSLSGGVDSMVLTKLLKKENYNIICVHFNHKKRKESGSEEKFVISYCEKNNILIKTFDVILENKNNFQKSAREFRYRKLIEVAREFNSSKILTAHHFDDLFETIIFKMLRGSSMKGYSGIQYCLQNTKENISFIRPLIFYSKDEIIEYANKNNIEYVTDMSNFSLDYTRNKIRHWVIPSIKKVKDNLKKQILDFSNKHAKVANYIKNIADCFMHNSSKFLINNFLKLDDVIKEEVISRLLENNEIIPSYNLIKEIIKNIENKKPNLVKKIKHVYFIKEYDYFYFANTFTKVLPKEYKLTAYCKTNKNNITYSYKDLNFNMPMGKITYNENDIKLPLYARLLKKDELLNYPFGKKKVSRLFIDRKVLKRDRDNILAVKDSNNLILWIPNLYLNQTIKGCKEIFFVYEGVTNEK